MESEGLNRFSQRALFVIISSALMLILLTLLWYAAHVLLLAFAGVLLGVLLHSLARFLRHRLGLNHGLALTIVIVVLLGGLTGAVYTAGTTLGKQGQTLVRQLPEAYDKLRDQARTWPLVGAWLGGEEDPPGAPGGHASASPPADRTNAPTSQPTSQPTADEELQQTIKDAAPRVATTLRTLVGSVMNGLVSLVVVSVVGIYIAASPMTYCVGIVRLTPKRYRERAAQTIAATVYTLRHWLIAQGITMVVVGVVTGAGLYFIGIKLWLLFGVLAALFNFVPNFGPLISYLPAVLMAWSDDPSKVLWVTILYLVAQMLEGYVLTPLVQRRAVDTPPAMLIVAQVLMGVLAGPIGVMLAAPLAAIGLVIVRMLYVEDALDDPKDPAADNPEILAMARQIQRATDT